MKTLGLEARGGRAESAPTIDALECHTDAWKYKRVRFHGMVQVMSIPSDGKGHPVNKSSRAQWRANGFQGQTTDEGRAARASSGHVAQGEIQSDLEGKRMNVRGIRTAASPIERNRRGNPLGNLEHQTRDVDADPSCVTTCEYICF